MPANGGSPFEVDRQHLTLVSAVVIALSMLLAQTVATIVAPGFRDETGELTIKFVRLSAPVYIFIIASVES